MKKIVNSRKYDTTTAKKLGEWTNGCYSTEQYFCKETLYRTKYSSYFIFGESGGLGKYSHISVGGGNAWGMEIVPLSESEAYEWCEEHLSVEEIEKIFPDRIIEA